MSVLVTTILKSFHLALQFGEMELQVLVDFSHLKELLFVVLSRYFLGLKFLAQVILCFSQRLDLFLAYEVLLTDFLEFLLELVQSCEFMLLYHVEVVLELYFLLQNFLEFISHDI